jgi:hypothetical protein
LKLERGRGNSNCKPAIGCGILVKIELFGVHFLKDTGYGVGRNNSFLLLCSNYPKSGEKYEIGSRCSLYRIESKTCLRALGEGFLDAFRNFMAFKLPYGTLVFERMTAHS